MGCIVFGGRWTPIGDTFSLSGRRAVTQFLLKYLPSIPRAEPGALSILSFHINTFNISSSTYALPHHNPAVVPVRSPDGLSLGVVAAAVAPPVIRLLTLFSSYKKNNIYIYILFPIEHPSYIAMSMSIAAASDPCTLLARCAVAAAMTATR